MAVNDFSNNSSKNTKGGSLALYDGVKESDFVNENIDERILRLLGLEDIFDIDYDTYLTLLKEKMAASRMVSSQIPIEEDQLLTEEFKRVKKKVGRFKIKKKKITVNDIGLNLSKNKVSPDKFLLTSKSISVVKTEGKKEDLVEEKKSRRTTLEIILESLESIKEILLEQSSLYKTTLELDRRRKENEKRSRRESDLESEDPSIVSKIAEKALAPFQSIIDRILRFFFFTLLGRGITSLLEWMANPINKKRLDTVIRFIKDWWPALLTGWFFFFNPLGRFIKSVIGSVIKLTFRLSKFAIPKLLSFIKANPFIAGAAAIGGMAFLANEVTGQRKAAGVQAENEARAQREEGLGVQGTDTMRPRTPFGMLQKVSNGGNIFSGIVDRNTGTTVSGAGQDTQFLPVEGGGGAVLQKGETVLQVGARERMIEKTGYDPLAFNIGSNANKPRKISSDIIKSRYGGLIGLTNGGAIGLASNLIKKEEALSSLTPGKNDYIMPGGISTLSNTPWSKINPETVLHSYLDTKNVPTIGWGSIYYDGMDRGTKPVRMGDKITKERADRLLNDNISKIASTYSKKMRHWSKMSPNQQASVISIGYNAGLYAPIGAYPKLTAALESGNMNLAAQEVQRSGPSAYRIAEERKLMRSGPLDLTKVTSQSQSSTKDSKKQQPSLLEKFSNIIGNIFKPSRGSFAKESQRPKPIKKQGGGLIKENTGLDISGATADRQAIYVQPGEYNYIIPKDAVMRGAVSAIDKIVASTDSNSNPVKMGINPLNKNYTKTLKSQRRKNSTITLPPITKSMSSKNSVQPSQGTETPILSAVSPFSINNRKEIAEIYELVV